jgi:PAS domain S-box-containing protein
VLAVLATIAVAGVLTHISLAARMAFVVLNAVAAVLVVLGFRTSEAHRRVEEALRQADKARADIKHALDQAAIVATTNVHGDITYVNEKFCEISGYTRDELMGQNHRLINSGLHPIEFFKDMYATIGRGQVWRGEIRNRAKNGSFYWVDTTIVPALDAHRHPSQCIAIRYDITDRKRSEAAVRDQNALAQLGKLAAVVAHEVRNPLAGIRGALQMIGRRLPPASQEHGIINEAIGRLDTLNDIVQDLLLFARPTQPVLARVGVATLIADTLALFTEDPETAGITVDVDESDAVVTADAEQLKLVLLNLLMNAAQAMHGAGTLTIRTRTAGSGCEIRIHDQGPGIPAEVREHLFEPFFTTRHRGTGLGLVTARRLMEAHGGTVTLECPREGGTTAIVSFGGP